jgi:hypothetical protein
VDAMVSKEQGASKRDILMRLVNDHPNEAAYLNAWREYHHTEGLEDHLQATAPPPREQTTYDALWNTGRR